MEKTNSHGDLVSLSENSIDIKYLSDYVSSAAAGAISSFAGVTRNNFEGKEVVSLFYEAYEDMALNEMIKLCENVI